MCKEMKYFSVRISIVCIVDDNILPENGYSLDIQVHIVEATDYDDAFNQALELGRKSETTYKNDAGNDVYWRFKEIENIRYLGSALTGMEVSSRLEGYFTQQPLTMKTKFNPEESTPIFDDEQTSYKHPERRNGQSHET